MKRPAMFPMEITIPPEFANDVKRDLDARGATVARTEERDGALVLFGEMPSARIELYGPALRSLTAGRGTFRAGYASPLPRP